MTTIRTFINSISTKKEGIKTLLGNNINTNSLFNELIYQNDKFLAHPIRNQLSNVSETLDKSPAKKYIEAHTSLNKLVDLLIENRSSKVVCTQLCNTENQQIIFSNNEKRPNKAQKSRQSDQKQKRSSDLHGFLRENYLKYKPKSPEEFWKILQKINDEEDSILQSMDSWSSKKPKINWISSHDNEQSLGKRGFQNFFYQKLKKMHS